MLNKKELKQLRSEISLNSLFLNDYKNNLFIKEKTANNFFNGYIEHLFELTSESFLKDHDTFDVIKEYDNINELWNYYLFFEDDPLLQDDYIAYTHINNFDGIAIYSIDDESIYPSIKAAFILNDGLYNKNTKIKNYKLYISVKNGYYFMLNKKRYYLNNFTRMA